MSSPVGYPQRGAYPMFSETSKGDVPVGKDGTNLIPVMANVTSSSRELVFSDNAPVAATVTTGARTSDAVIAGILVSPFVVTQPITLNRVSGYVAVTQQSKLVEIGLYDKDKNLLATTERREVPEVGPFQFAHQRVTLQPGTYFYALSCNGTTAAFGVVDALEGFSATLAMPLAAKLGALTTSWQRPYLVGHKADNFEVVNFTDVSDPARKVRVYGSASGGKVLGIDVSTFKFVYSTDGGATWIQMMPYPPTGSAWIDMIGDGTRFYALTISGRIWASTGYTAGDTVSEVSCPIQSGLRRQYTLGRPYALAIFNDYLFQGEYSTVSASLGTGELTNDPSDPAPARILKYGPLSGTPAWTLSKQFTNGRHVHAFHTVGSIRMWASIGDAASGSDVGIWRLTNAVTEDWVRWTRNDAGYTDHYPVDMIDLSVPGSGKGIYGAGDRRGVSLTFTKATGVASNINIDRQLYTAAGQDVNETSRSLAHDAVTKNLYWFTEETTTPAVWMTPPPYTQPIKLTPIAMELVTRSVVNNGYLLCFDKRFTLPKLPWQ